MAGDHRREIFIENSMKTRRAVYLLVGAVARGGRAFHSRIPVVFERSEERDTSSNTVNIP